MVSKRRQANEAPILYVCYTDLPFALQLMWVIEDVLGGIDCG